MDAKQIKLFSSKNTDHWSTPKDLFLSLDKEFNFNFDPCPLRSLVNGLSIKWGSRCFVNPPYSNVEQFLIKAHTEINRGNTEVAVFLLFSNTDTKWFHKYIKDKAEIRFIQGRVSFLDLYGEKLNSAMRPSMVCVLKKGGV